MSNEEKILTLERKVHDLEFIVLSMLAFLGDDDNRIRTIGEKYFEAKSKYEDHIPTIFFTGQMP